MAGTSESSGLPDLEVCGHISGSFIQFLQPVPSSDWVLGPELGAGNRQTESPALSEGGEGDKSREIRVKHMSDSDQCCQLHTTAGGEQRGLWGRGERHHLSGQETGWRE